jgi:hypothetical protein
LTTAEILQYSLHSIESSLLAIWSAATGTMKNKKQLWSCLWTRQTIASQQLNQWNPRCGELQYWRATRIACCIVLFGLAWWGFIEISRETTEQLLQSFTWMVMAREEYRSPRLKQGSSHSCNRVCRFWHFEILREVYESRLRVILCIFRHPNARWSSIHQPRRHAGSWSKTSARRAKVTNNKLRHRIYMTWYDYISTCSRTAKRMIWNSFLGHIAGTGRGTETRDKLCTLSATSVPAAPLFVSFLPLYIDIASIAFNS